MREPLHLAERFYCPELPPEGTAQLRGEEARHLARVRRVPVGAEIELFDGVTSESRRARVRLIGREVVELDVVGPATSRHEPVVSLTLAVAVPKADRFDWLVEKAVEVGVETLQPILTERSVVNPRASKLDRQRQRVIEASKQCGRNRLMTINEPALWRDVIAQRRDELRLLATAGTPFRGQVRGGSAIVLAVGPEGGFTAEEQSAALAGGWKPIGLGPSILRIETAAVVGAGIVLARAWEELIQ